MSQQIKVEVFGVTAEVLDKICKATGLNVEEIMELQQDFFEELPVEYEEALEAERSGDTKALARFGHSIKGSAGQVGLFTLQEIGRELENSAATDREKWFELANKSLELAKIWKECSN